MDEKNKAIALDMLEAKLSDSSITYAQIAERTGYTKRHLMRLSAQMQSQGKDATMSHGNAGRKPSNAAGAGEIEFMRRLKEPYPHITIAHFRDIFLEDVLANPSRSDEVKEYGLVPRSVSWFRGLFEREGWVSPASKPRRSQGTHVTHPIREPMARRGALVQIDASSNTWIGSCEPWCMHISIDDATTDVLAGWFMPVECTRGYSRMMSVMLVNKGRPRALYSDKHSVFKASKGDGPTQFGQMMGDLGITTIYANTSQAKGRVERYNRTAQLRLPNDCIRFGICDYATLNVWFNSFYASYLNSKFSFTPREPIDDFVSLPEGFDLSSVLRTRLTRISNGGRISYENRLYYMVDALTGEFFDPGDGSSVDVHVDTLTERMYVEHDGVRYACVDAGERRHTPIGVHCQRELANLLKGYWPEEQ